MEIDATSLESIEQGQANHDERKWTECGGRRDAYSLLLIRLTCCRFYVYLLSRQRTECGCTTCQHTWWRMSEVHQIASLQEFWENIWHLHLGRKHVLQTVHWMDGKDEKHGCDWSSALTSARVFAYILIPAHLGCCSLHFLDMYWLVDVEDAT